MPHLLEGLPKKAGSGGGGRRSSVALVLEQCADGKPWFLESGIDYSISTSGLRSACLTFARRGGLKVSTRSVEGGMAVQFTPLAPTPSGV